MDRLSFEPITDGPFPPLVNASILTAGNQLPKTRVIRIDLEVPEVSSRSGIAAENAAN